MSLKASHNATGASHGLSGPRCVYTTLVGQYEPLNEQPVRHRSNFRFICLTDDPSLRSESWECRLVTPLLPMDPVRSQRELKIRPHVWMPEFSGSLYIDNSVVLKEPPERFFELMGPDQRFLLPFHSFRETVLDEFIEVAHVGLDDEMRLLDQLNHYTLSHPSVLMERPWWTAIMVRDHQSAQVRKMLDIWALHVHRYSRRDQLSVNVAFGDAGFHPAALEIDNFVSDLHTWPHAQGRDRHIDARRPAVSRLREAAREWELEARQRNKGTTPRELRQIAVRRQQREWERLSIDRDAAHRALLDAVREHSRRLSLIGSSLSWRVARPLRAWLRAHSHVRKTGADDSIDPLAAAAGAANADADADVDVELRALRRVYPQAALTLALLYRIVLGRAPDPPGELFYLEEVAARRSLKEIAQDLLASPEYQSLAPGTDWWRRACRNAGEPEKAPSRLQSPASYCCALALRESVRRRYPPTGDTKRLTSD